MTTTTRVILADDHPLMRAGIRSQLQEIPGIEVVAEASDGLAALQLTAQHKPRLVVMDVSMPGMNGLEVAARLAKEQPEVRVIMLSMHTGEEYVRRALKAGARAYVLKDADSAELRIAVAAALRGDLYLSPGVSKHLLADLVSGGSHKGELERLTPRQREVLQLVAEGRRTKEIARQLKISARTVETHRLQLMQQLDIRDVAGLVRFAIRVGLIQPED